MPAIPLSDVSGNAFKVPPEHIGAIGSNAGVMLAPTVATGILNVAVQPRASFTVIVYGNEARPKKILLAWNIIPSLLYVSGNVPPVAMAVMVPSPDPHDAGDEVAVNEGPVRFTTGTGNIFIHPFASFTYNV